MALKLSDIDPTEIEVIEEPINVNPEMQNQGGSFQTLKLSDLSDEDIEIVEEPEDKRDFLEKIQPTLEGFGQGASAGYLAQLQAIAEPITDRIFNLFSDDKNVELAPWSQAIAKGPEYVKSRDINIARQQKFKEERPWEYRPGEIAGTLITGIAAQPAQAASLGGRAIQAAGIGAAYGLLSNPGDVEGIVDELQVSPRLKNAAFNALTGLGAQAGLDAIIKYSKPLARQIFKIAENRAAKGLGWTKAAARGMSEEQIEAAGRLAIDEDIIKPSLFGNVKKMQQRTTNVLEEAGREMENVINVIDEAGLSNVNPKQLAADIDEKIGGFWRDPINKAETRQYENIMESVLARGDENITLRQAQDLKKTLAKVADFKNPNPQEKAKMAREAYFVVSDAIDDSAEQAAKQIGNVDLLGQLTKAKQKYSAGKNAMKFIEKRLSQQGNRTVSLTDFIVGSAATAKLGPLFGPMAVIGKKLGEKYGNQVAARYVENIGKSLIKMPKLANFVNRNPQAYRALVYKLAENYQYRKKFNIESFDKPKKIMGKNLWLVNGLDNISDQIDIEDPEITNKLLFSKRGEKLLSQASGLKKGSRALNNLIEKINKYIGENYGNQSNST